MLGESYVWPAKRDGASIMRLMFLIFIFPLIAKAQLVNPAGDMILSTSQTVTGAKTFNQNRLALAGSTSGILYLNASGTVSSDWNFLTGPDVVVGASSTQSLSNKTLTTGNTISGTVTMSNAVLSGTTTLGGPVGLTGVVSGGHVSGTQITVNANQLTMQADSTKKAIFNMSNISLNTTRTYAWPDRSDTVVLEGGAQTLASKTLTNPTINGWTASGTLTTNETLVMALNKGMDFSATSNGAASMTTEVFSDSETGTWQPIIFGTTSSPSSVTYAQHRGWYEKYNKMVCYGFFIDATTVTGGAGNYYVSGMPFTVDTVANKGIGGGAVIYKSGWNTNGPDFMYAIAGTRALQLFLDNNTGQTAITIANGVSGHTVGGSGCYPTSE